MLGKNPLWVARQHGHSVRTVLDTYAAWLDGSTESDLIAITRALNAPLVPATQAIDMPITSTLGVPYGLSRPHDSPKAVTRVSLEQEEKIRLPDSWWESWRRHRDSNRTHTPYRINKLRI